MMRPSVVWVPLTPHLLHYFTQNVIFDLGLVDIYPFSQEHNKGVQQDLSVHNYKIILCSVS
jgi:hypothetical protein